MDAEQLKGLGNEALKRASYDEAIKYYTEAIEMAKSNSQSCHVYFSNRCAAYQQKKEYHAALEDADKCIGAKADWPKGYLRRGNTLEFLSRYAEAEAAYKQGLEVSPSDAGLQKALNKVQEDQLPGPGNSQPMGGAGAKSPLGDPKAIMEKLEADPVTRGFMADPTYMKMLQDLSQNPQNMMQYMQDPRLMKTLQVITGINMDGSPAGGDAPTAADNESMSDNPQSTAECPMKEATPSFQESKPKEEMEVEEEDETPQNIKESLEEKAKGTAAYKVKDFDTAHSHYAKAFELDSSNMVFLMNTAAVYLEQKNFSKCRETCEKAIIVGRENKGDFKMIAKALARIGTSYQKENDFENSLLWFNKSVSEFRDKKVLETIKKMEKAKKDEEKRAYWSDEEFAKSKQQGNEAFKSGKYPDAVQHYNDCIKRKNVDDKANGDDLAIIYSNRAACYTKLMEPHMAVSDCEKANKYNPNYVKAYLRKGTALEAMKKNSEAKAAFSAALGLEPNSSEAQEGIQRCIQKSYETRNDEASIKERVKNDPEVIAIMQDPSMRLILDQMQSDPNAIQEHLKNPMIAQKIQKLMDVGIIQMGHR